MTQLVSELESEDKAGYYIEEFWLESEQFTAAQSKQYLRQIKNPMCFKIMRSNIHKFLDNPEQLKLDCLQIFLNAKSYNKYTTAIHKDAERLYQICLEKLTQYMPLLEKQAQLTAQEDQYVQYILSSSQQTLKSKQIVKLSPNSIKKYENEDLPKILGRIGDYIIPEEL